MRLENPFHEGELLVQERLGELQEGARNGRAISDSILKGAIKYIEQQSLAAFGSIDAGGNVWASVLIGTPGFLRALDERSVEVDLTRTVHNKDDPLWTNIESDRRVGMLVIDLATRRRLRVNGQIASTAPDRLRLDVVESFPNCPKYIRRRRLVQQGVDHAHSVPAPREGERLDPEREALVRAADTFFVASAHPERGVDASHRGGPPGFLRTLNDRTIRVPDYVGNRMYNTLGNFTANPRAGLVFFDFERSRTLQLIGRPEIVWEVDDPSGETGGTGRYWDFEVERWLETDLRRKLEWELLDPSNAGCPPTVAGVLPTG